VTYSSFEDILFLIIFQSCCLYKIL